MTQTAQQMKNFLAKIADIRPSVVAIEHEYGQWCCWHFSGFRPFILCLCCAIGNWTAFKLHRNEKYMYGNNNEMSIQMHFSWYERGFMRKPLFSCSRHFQWPLANDVNGHKRAFRICAWWLVEYSIFVWMPAHRELIRTTVDSFCSPKHIFTFWSSSLVDMH